MYQCGPEDHANPAYKIYIDDGKKKMADDCTPIQLGGGFLVVLLLNSIDMTVPARKTTSKEQVWAYE